MKAVPTWLLAFAPFALTGALAQAPGDSRPVAGAPGSQTDSPPRPNAPDPQTDSQPALSKPDARTDSSPTPAQKIAELRTDSQPGAGSVPADLGPATPAFLDLGLDAGVSVSGDAWVEHPLRSSEKKHLQSASPGSALTQPPDPAPLETGAPQEPRIDHFSPVEPPMSTSMPAEPPVLPPTQPPIPAAIEQQMPGPPPSTTMPSLPDPFSGLSVR